MDFKTSKVENSFQSFEGVMKCVEEIELSDREEVTNLVRDKGRLID